MKCISGGECYKGKYCQCVSCRQYENNYISRSSTLPGLTEEENKEIAQLREMTIGQAGIRGIQRFNELGNKVIDTLIHEWNW